jgi:hypothetical protein
MVFVRVPGRRTVPKSMRKGLPVRAADEEILRLQVPVVHAASVQHAHGAHHVTEGVHQFGRVTRLAPTPPVPVVPVHIVGDEEGVAPGGVGPEVHRVHAQQVGMGGVGEEGRRLACEPPVGTLLLHVFVLREFLPEEGQGAKGHLQGVENPLPLHLEDAGEASTAQFLDDAPGPHRVAGLEVIRMQGLRRHGLALL